MLAPRSPLPERLGSYLAQSLARLYVTARAAEQWDQYVGLENNSVTEMIARALFAANRQGRVSITPPGAKPRPVKNWRESVTETVLGVEVTATRRQMDMLQALAAHSPLPVSRHKLAAITGQAPVVMAHRITGLRELLRLDGRLDIPSRTNAYGWALTVTGATS